MQEKAPLSGSVNGSPLEHTCILEVESQLHPSHSEVASLHFANNDHIHGDRLHKAGHGGVPGSSTEINNFGVGYSASVVTLPVQYLNKGLVLWVDNWRTSPSLFIYLFEKKTNAYRTVHAEEQEGSPSRKLKTVGRGNQRDVKDELLHV